MSTYSSNDFLRRVRQRAAEGKFLLEAMSDVMDSARGGMAGARSRYSLGSSVEKAVERLAAGVARKEQWSTEGMREEWIATSDVLDKMVKLAAWTAGYTTSDTLDVIDLALRGGSPHDALK